MSVRARDDHSIAAGGGAGVGGILVLVSPMGVMVKGGQGSRRSCSSPSWAKTERGALWRARAVAERACPFRALSSSASSWLVLLLKTSCQWNLRGGGGGEGVWWCE